MTDNAQTDFTAAPAGETLRVPLDRLEIASENLRAHEAADPDIPELADTIAAADLLYPLLVRPGRKGEAADMVLDGRRRLLALRLLVDDGRTAADRLVKVDVAQPRPGRPPPSSSPTRSALPCTWPM